MSAKSGTSQVISSRSTLQVACAAGAALVGLVLLSYVVYFVPNQLGPSTADMSGLLVFVALVALLSLLGAMGYWLGKKWGWFVQLASTVGQLLLPGALFEFKLDLYHLVGWIIPVVSLAIVIAMGLAFRRAKQSF